MRYVLLLIRGIAEYIPAKLKPYFIAVAALGNVQKMSEHYRIRSHNYEYCGVTFYYET